MATSRLSVVPHRENKSATAGSGNRKLSEHVRTLQAEVQRLWQKNEELQEQIEVSEISWSAFSHAPLACQPDFAVNQGLYQSF